MKKKIIYATVLCGGLFLFLDAFHEVNKHDRNMKTVQNIKQLALALEIYSGDQGKFPSSLSELLAAQSDDITQKSLSQLIHDKWNHVYEYQPQTNGFVIIVTSLDGRFSKGDHYLVEYTESTNHTLLKINGSNSGESWIGEIPSVVKP